MAAAALVALLLAASAILTPRVTRDGWYSITPRITLILLLPDLQHWSPAAEADLIARFRSDPPSDFEWNLILARVVDEHAPPWKARIETRPVWPEDVTPQVRMAADRQPCASRYLNWHPITVQADDFAIPWGCLGAPETASVGSGFTILPHTHDEWHGTIALRPLAPGDDLLSLRGRVELRVSDWTDAPLPWHDRPRR